MEKDIYSRENLEGFANDLLYYLYKTKSYRVEEFYVENERLSDNVYIYTLNKRYSINEENYTYKFKNTPILVEDNINVEEWLEYYNKKTLTFSMDSVLNEYLYWYDVPDCRIVTEKIDKIFAKHGFYKDFGTSYIVFAWTKDDYPED